MRGTGCWDCGSEVASHLSHCPMCGWPAPAARPAPRRRRLIPILAIAALLTCAATYVVARAEPSSRAPATTVGKCLKHKLVYREDGNGRVFVCIECGLSYRIDNRRRGSAFRHLQSTFDNP